VKNLTRLDRELFLQDRNQNSAVREQRKKLPGNNIKALLRCSAYSAKHASHTKAWHTYSKAAAKHGYRCSVTGTSQVSATSTPDQGTETAINYSNHSRQMSRCDQTALIPRLWRLHQTIPWVSRKPLQIVLSSQSRLLMLSDADTVSDIAH
jgi:hypothetical protein